MQFHMHKFKFESNETNYHKHKILGYTEHTIGINTLHFSYLYGCIFI